MRRNVELMRSAPQIRPNRLPPNPMQSRGRFRFNPNRRNRGYNNYRDPLADFGRQLNSMN